MSTRKQKLEASLEGLFSSGKPRPKGKPEAEEPAPAASEPERPAPEEKESERPTRVSASPRKKEEIPLAPVSDLPTPVPAQPPVRATSEGAAPVTIGEKQTVAPVDVRPSDLKSAIGGKSEKATVEATILDEGLRIVAFMLNNNFYGVDISTVQTIIKPQDVTPVPFTPGYVEGLTNLRGQIVPIIDLRARLGFPPQESDKDTRIIIISIRNEWAGIRVDAVTGVTNLPSDRIEPPAGIVSGTDTALLSGIARSDKNIILILDTEALFGAIDRSGRRGGAGNLEDM